MKWGLLAVPIIIMVCVGWFKSVFNVCPTVNAGPGCVFGNISPTSSVFTNPLTSLLQGNLAAFLNSIGGDLTAAIGGRLAVVLPAIAGIILLILGLGVTVQVQIVGSGGLFGVGPEGSRMFMAMGVGLIIWSWLTSFTITSTGTVFDPIPFGIGNILFSVLTIAYTIGLYDLGRSHF
jgi:hypothetical protein